jgi:hypothetical protein
MSRNFGKPGRPLMPTSRPSRRYVYMAPLLRTLDLTRSSIAKYLNWRVLSNPRSTVKMNWNNVLTIWKGNSTDYARPTTLLNMLTVGTPRSQLPERTTMIGVNCVKVHIVLTLVLFSLAKLWMMSTRLLPRAVLANFVRIARYV